MSKIIVIGAGIAGLATALRLQAKGHQVTVIEQADGPGGKLREKQHGDFRFDLGPSLFTLPELVEEVLTLGNTAPTPFPFEKLDRSCHYFWEDGATLVAYEEKSKLAQEVEQQLGANGKEVLKHLESSAFLYKHTAKLFMHRSLHKLKSYLSKTVLQALVRVHKFNLTTSLHEVNEKRFSWDSPF